MRNCTDCKHAKWERTKAGRLHPSGDGLCTWEYVVPKLPESMYWNTYSGKPPGTSGGHINRREEFKEHCAYFEREG